MPSSDWAAREWPAAFARLSAPPARFGLLYLNLGTWPVWVDFTLRAAAANRGVDFYFVGDRLDTSRCTNCAWLPLDLIELRRRVRRHVLDAAEVEHFGEGGRAPRKLCDLGPMWPALYPELSARHAFIGVTEQDVLFGDVSSELARLRDDDDMMVPLERYPSPITDVNFMVYRSTPKMLQAFRRVPGWERVVTSNRHFRFDEWVARPQPSVMRAFQDMMLASQLNVLPARRLLVQDAVIILGTSFPLINHGRGAVANFFWRGGRLELERHGPCMCPRDVVPVFGVSVCMDCLKNPGRVLPKSVSPWTHRRLEVLGVHFTSWKKAWRRRKHQTNGSWAEAGVPTCPPGADFNLSAAGFRCIT